MNCVDLHYHGKIEVTRYALGEKKSCNLKNIDFEKKGLKVKKKLFSISILTIEKVLK